MVYNVLGIKKDLGKDVLVFDALPYAVWGDSYEGSFLSPATLFTALSHMVPAGLQLKVLFLRVWTQETTGARFSIVQYNPLATDAWAAAAYPVVGSVPPFTAGLTAVRDRPFLEAAGAEALRGSLVDPVHVLEGSITFNIHNTPTPATGSRYSITYWGVEKQPIASPDTVP